MALLKLQDAASLPAMKTSMTTPTMTFRMNVTMKKIIFSVSAIVLGFAFSTSCQKEIAQTEEPTAKEPIIMTVNAESVATKTFVEEVSATEYNLKWSAGDAIACYEVSVVEETPTIQSKVTSSALEADAASASFTLDFSGNAGDPNFSYIFVYPASKYTKSGETYRAQIPDKQTFSATSFDKDADVLISRAITDQTSRPTTVDAEFERIGATALMNIKAPTTTEKIRSITFSTTETSAYLAGYVKVYPLAGTHETEIYNGGTDGRSITLTPASSTTYTGTIPVWFRLGEIALSNNFTVVVTTNKKIYTKTVDLASARRTLEFNNSGLTKFNVNMASVEGVDNPSLDNGDYFIVAKHSGNYYAMSSTANGSRLGYVQLDDFDPDADYYTGTDSNLEWTITNEGDAITIEQGDGTYLTPGNGAASTGTTKKTYTLSSGKTSGTLRLNSVNKSGYGLRFNANSKWFAFYNSGVNESMIGDIYFMPKDPRTRVAAPTNVEAAASGTSIIVTWDDAFDANIDHYLVTLSGDADDSQNVAVGKGRYEFTGLSDGTYSVSVEAVPSNTTLYRNSLPETVSGIKVGAFSSDYSYTFTTKEWVSDPEGWTSVNNGSATDARGIAVQKADSGAGATSPVSYTNVSHVSITLSKSNKGAGKVTVKVGDTTVLTRSSFTTSATTYEADVNNLTGKVSFVVTCTTSTIYVQDITITATGTSE